MTIKFFRYHGLGNDYIVIDPNKSEINLTIEKIRLICDRNFGIGSDGILFGPIFEDNKIRLRILNPDGSEAEKSGNGIRIFSRYLLDSNYVSEKQFFLDTLGGKVRVEYLDNKGYLIKVDMGIVTFQSNLIPVKGNIREVVNEKLLVGNTDYKVACLSIGNPHCVIPLENISKELVCKIGVLVENHIMFPNRINLQLLKVVDKNNIQIEIWERGAGYTMASGSSSCAAASAAYRLGLVDNKIKVHMPGGSIDIEIGSDGHVCMIGTVCSIATGELTEQFIKQLESC